MSHSGTNRLSSGAKIGDRFAFETPDGKFDGLVVGLYGGDTNDGTPCIGMHYERYVEAAPALKGRVGSIWFMVPRDSQREIASTIDGGFATSDEPTLTATREAVMTASFLKGNLAIPKILLKIATLMIGVTALVTASTITTSMRERRGDFGVLRALGYKRLHVAGLVYLEVLAVCVLGGLIGGGIPFLLFRHTGIPLGSDFLSNVQVSPISFGKGMLVALAIALVSGLAPALETFRLDVVRALGRA